MKLEDLLGLAVPVTYLLMFMSERRWPARQFPKLRWWGLIGAGFMLVMMSAGVIVTLLLPLEWLATHRLLDGTRLGVVGGTVVGFLVVELLVYGYHRACHTYPFLWRALHQMHHAPQRMDIPGSAVFHPLELLAQNTLGLGTLVFVLGLEPTAVACVGFLLGFYALFQHWNVKTPSFLGYFIQRPEAHCHHHELEVHASNYADFPPWDMLFGTFRNPETFGGQVGFAERASFGKMLIGVDVNAGQAAGQPGAPSARLAAAAE